MEARTEPESAEARTARTLSDIAQQEGFEETSDPALQESADRGQAKLLDYGQLYELWERQQWATQDLDFSQDRIDWHERISEEERFQRMYGLSGFFIGEQRVTDELGPIMRACPKRGAADLPLHPDRRRGPPRPFLRPLLQRGRRATRAPTASPTGCGRREENLNESFGQLFDDLLHTRVDRLAAEPEDTVALVEAVTLYHMIIEGALALTGQHFIIEYNTEQNTLPAFVEGFNKVARDEHRHIAFGVRFLTDMAQEDPKYRDAMQRMMGEALPIADGVLDPPWAEDEDLEMFGVSRDETHAFAAQCLTRRLKVIGLA